MATGSYPKQTSDIQNPHRDAEEAMLVLLHQHVDFQHDFILFFNCVKICCLHLEGVVLCTFKIDILKLNR